MTSVTTHPPAGSGSGPETVDAPRSPIATRLVRILTRGPAQIFLFAIALFWLIPTIGLFVSSFRSASDSQASGWWTVWSEPSQLSLENYRTLLSNDGFVRSIWNTALITIPTTIIVLLVASLAAYAFAWMRFPGRDAIFLLVIGLLVVPLQVALIPLARLFGDLGIFGSIPSVVLFHVAFGLPFAIFLLRNFFLGIPRELLEAARMEGAGELGVFVRVVMPLAVPALASLTIFQFLFVWNDLLVALVFAGPEAAPLTVTIREQTRQFGSNVDVIATGAFISMIVPLAVFFAFQRYFVQGILAGSVK